MKSKNNLEISKKNKNQSKPDLINNDLRNDFSHYYRDVLGLPDWENRVEHRLELQEAKTLLSRLQKLGVELENKRIIDLGCGWGDLLITLTENFDSALFIGIEPDQVRINLANQRSQNQNFRSINFVMAIGERVPIVNHSIDIIITNQVLEHVHSPLIVLQELIRILKPEGILYLVLPNYGAFFEPHYKIRWFPFLPKSLLRKYLVIRKRPPDFLDHFNHTYAWQISRFLNSEPVITRNIVREKITKGFTKDPSRENYGLHTRIFIHLINRKPLSLLFNHFITIYCWFFVKRQEYLVIKLGE